MLGSILVMGCMIIVILLSLSIYYQKSIINFILIMFLFFWSSFSYFFANNYEGWPSKENFPKSQVVGIQIIQPTNIEQGRIFVWVYHIGLTNKRFFEYNPKNIPRAYEIPYTKESEKSFKEALELLQNGNLLFMNAGSEDAAPGTGRNSGKQGTKRGNKYNIIYDIHMPPIEVINPRDILKK